MCIVLTDGNPSSVIPGNESISIDDSNQEPILPETLSYNVLLLPNNDWKIMSIADGKLLLCELTFSATTCCSNSRKTVEVDTKERTSIYRVRGKSVHSAHLPFKFASIIELERILKSFDQSALCKGIANQKYNSLIKHNIPSGSFDEYVCI